jgi:ferrochelatase
MMTARKLVIFSQIGSPQKPEPKAVGEYLRRFLMDEKVITGPAWYRKVLVEGLIIPLRKKSSAKKYHKIWTKEGSPLVVETEKFLVGLRTQLGEDWQIALHWRYGEKSPEEQLQSFASQTYDEVLIAPLYPQYAEATTGSAVQLLKPFAQKTWPRAGLKVLKPFYHESAFVQAFARKVKEALTPGDHVLFSYHGLPQRQIRQNPGCRLNEVCCARADISHCYLAQCRRTTKLLAEALALSDYSMSFQSRLGPTKWLEPSSEEALIQLLGERKTRLVVACPAFVTDGLETLEEIGIGLKTQFLQAGGEKFELVSGLNDDSFWVQEFAQLLHRSGSWLE